MSYWERMKTKGTRVVEVMRSEDSARVAEEQIKAAKATQALIDLRKVEDKIKAAERTYDKVIVDTRRTVEDMMRKANVESIEIRKAAEDLKFKATEEIAAQKTRLTAREGSVIYAEDTLKRARVQLSQDQGDLEEGQKELGVLSQKLTGEGTRLAALDKKLQLRGAKQEEEQARLLYLEKAIKDRDIELRKWDDELSEKLEKAKSEEKGILGLRDIVYRKSGENAEESAALKTKRLAFDKEKAEWADKKAALKSEYDQMASALKHTESKLSDICSREDEVGRKEKNLLKKSRELGYLREELRGAEKALRKGE